MVAIEAHPILKVPAVLEGDDTVALCTTLEHAKLFAKAPAMAELLRAFAALDDSDDYIDVGDVANLVAEAHELMQEIDA